MANSADVEERREAADRLQYNFASFSDKDTVWSDLIRLTQDKDSDVRRSATRALGSVFSDVPFKDAAWSVLIRLTQDEGSDVRMYAASALGSVFSDVPDKDAAWSDLIRLTQDEGSDVRMYAASALGSVFSDVPDKDAAWSDLIRLTQDEDSDVRMYAASMLDYVFSDVPDKDAAWSDLHRLTQDEDSDVRWNAASVLGSIFSDVPDKDAAWSDLIRLTQDEDSDVRINAASALGSVFPDVPDKDAAWSDLIRLTQNEDSNVRMYAYHSLGSASVYKATKTEDEAKFRKELKKAIDYFEQSSNEAKGRYYHPARFCLPFYRSYYAVISNKQEAETEAAKYLDEAKNAAGGSESREMLLKAVKNLANALREAQKPLDFGETKEHLRVCRQYCDHTAELADSTRGKSPVAVAAIMRGIPIVEVKVKAIIAEIQENAKELCKHTQGTLLAEQGKEVNIAGQNFLNVRDPIVLDKAVLTLEKRLSAVCDKMPEDERGDACGLLNEIKDEIYVEDKINLVNILIEKMSAQIKRGKKMGKYEIRDSIFQINEGSNNVQSLNNPPISNEMEKTVEEDQSLEKKINPYSSELESEIADIFKSIYQKDRKEGVSEVNAKTLESLKHKIHDLKASGNNINWLDMGCGDGRCLEVLDDIQNRGDIYYHGIDISHKFLDDAQTRAKKYGIKSKIEAMSTSAMEFDSKFDLVSAVLFLHEVDPLCLPYVIRNMLRALKSDGTLVISDFEGPYEQEEGVVSWGVEYLGKFLLNIGGARMSPGFMPSGESKEFGFYRCYVKKPELDENVFQKFIDGYSGFMKEKKEDSRKMRDELRSQIKKKVCEILERPDIDLKNISDDEKALLRESMEKEYGFKALKIRLLTNEILFLDEKIGEFERGQRCDSI